ncbi:MAG: type II toxin-antitoxin system VapB family antitoxin [Chloroflexi bacterium]|nr:type II toxin-antitoxin system VapB family antitoxin [Chloroflexota bacterium]
MRTTLDIDKEVLDEVVRLKGERGKSKAVTKALQDYVRRKKIEKLWSLAGRIDLVDNWYELRHMEPPMSTSGTYRG